MLRLSKEEDSEDLGDVLPPGPFSCKDELDKWVWPWREHGLREMARSPEWNKFEYSTPVAKSFAFNQDIVRLCEGSG